MGTVETLSGIEDAEPAGHAHSKSTRRQIAAAGVAVTLFLLLWLIISAPLSKSLRPAGAPSITLVSSSGDPIARRGPIVDEPVLVDRLSDHAWQAFLAIEDRRFYHHTGVDPWGVLRATLRNVFSGSAGEGGSTITQQLAKQSFLSSDRTAARKIREMLIAFWLEAWLSKDQILERYMSSAYFGDNVYGLRAASKHYFDKDPEELGTSEAAMLAGLVKAPSRLAPTKNFDLARERGRVVLKAMVDAGFLDDEERQRLQPPRLRDGGLKSVPSGSYFSDWVFANHPDLAEDFEETTIRTTLDSRLQTLAARTIDRAALRGAQAALVAMTPDGRVVAMIGGEDYKQSAYNRATQAKRQPGSTFKLFVYLAALQDGMTPDSLVLDQPITVEDWTPANSDGKYRGEITLREAFSISSNVATVRIAEKVGRRKIIGTAKDFGISSELSSHPSLALGTSATTLLEMTAAYAGVAGNRYPVSPRGLPQEERKGFFQALVEDQDSLDTRTTLPMIKDLLWSAVNLGTGRAAALQTQTFGKTGTTQDNRDAIFIGFAENLVVGVWVGNDDNSPLGDVAGGGLPARIWRDFMSSALNNTSPRSSSALPRVTAEPLDSAQLIPRGRGREEQKDRDKEREKNWEKKREKKDKGKGKKGKGKKGKGKD